MLLTEVLSVGFCCCCGVWGLFPFVFKEVNISTSILPCTREAGIFKEQFDISESFVVCKHKRLPLRTQNLN